MDIDDDCRRTAYRRRADELIPRIETLLINIQAGESLSLKDHRKITSVLRELKELVNG